MASGHIVRRGRNSWSVVLEFGRHTDPKTGKKKRRQKWISVRGTKRDAQRKLRELLVDADQGRLIEPSRINVEEWLTMWMREHIGFELSENNKRIRTFETYESVVENHLKPSLGIIPLQQLAPIHIREYHRTKASSLSKATRQQHHAILHRALRDAERDGYVSRNVAALVSLGSSKRDLASSKAPKLLQYWTQEEALRFLAVAHEAGDQPAAFYHLALDTGMRLGELCGLLWPDLDLEACVVHITRQLPKAGAPPVFGPVKNGEPRDVEIARETALLLAEHRRHQAEIKMQNRVTYQDFNLVFAKEWGNRNAYPGQPLQRNNLTQREFSRLVKKAGVTNVGFHGMRHTCATLLLEAGESYENIAKRLGHRDPGVTMRIYAHVTKKMERQTTKTIRSILYGSGVRKRP